MLDTLLALKHYLSIAVFSRVFSFVVINNALSLHSMIIPDIDSMCPVGIVVISTKAACKRA